MSKAIAHLGMVSLLVIVLGISAVGLYFGYSLPNHSNLQANSVSLQSFSINPSTSNLTGSIKVNSNSPLSRMSLFINGTFMGSFNYSSHFGMMSTMMSGYPYSYSMMHSWYPSEMPMMQNYQFMHDRTYMIKMMATFEDGSVCNATIFVRP